MTYTSQNPFEYEAATNLSSDDIIGYYIEDFNYSRFLQSTKNVFLIGERGSGKTMALLYNSFKIQYKIAKSSGNISYNRIGVHIPCITPLFLKKEHLLIKDEYKKAIVCEHFLVLSIMYAIADTLACIPEIVECTQKRCEELSSEMSYLWGIKIDYRSDNFYNTIKSIVNKRSIETQKHINEFDSDSFSDQAISFSSTVLPLLQTLNSHVSLLKDTHYMLMIDDAHDMNEYQIKALNSWIAYRDHSLFSFKVAAAKVDLPIRITATGGAILEGHDFITVDMEHPYMNGKTDFYKLSKQIVEKRLHRLGIERTAEEFFPMNNRWEEDLVKCEEKAKQEATAKYGVENQKAVSDYVYKYKRAIYFRDRKSQANRPPYSGFQTIVDISTGVVRNMLDPCYWMYDCVKNTEKGEIFEISPSTQTNIIIQRSDDLWKTLRSGLDKFISDCTEKDAKHIQNLFERLMELFSKRLQTKCSEPRAIVFSISQSDALPEKFEKLERLLKISQRAQILYIRNASAKERGKQDVYYVPNRLLLPVYGLDPNGQFARVSLTVENLYLAAFNNRTIPFSRKDTKLADSPKLF